MSSNDPTTHTNPEWARRSLEGLSVGDAFGQTFFIPGVLESATPDNLPVAPWEYTDDTEMAMAVVRTLEVFGSIDSDFLAQEFAARYRANPYRGYGAGARELLESILSDGDWRELSRGMFGGTGSFGNGAAMRVAPIGAWFDDTQTVIEQATLSAEVTHAHPEGVAGAIAVALAAWWAKQHALNGAAGGGSELIPWIIEHLPASEVRTRCEWVQTYPFDTWPFTIASQVGCGEQISAQDTVPYCLWMMAANWADFETALWTAARVGGDVDTNCAIIGGVLALCGTETGIPKRWVESRESLGW